MIKINLDFELNAKRFNPLEIAIFYIIHDGYQHIEDIKAIFYIFSNDVISSAITHLVNEQLLELDLFTGGIDYSDYVKKFKAICESSEKKFVLPDEYSFLSITEGVPLPYDTNQGILKIIDESEELTVLNHSINLLVTKDENDGSI